MRMLKYPHAGAAGVVCVLSVFTLVSLKFIVRPKYGSSVLVPSAAVSQPITTCQEGPLTEITDPVAKDFENGNQINTEKLTPDMQNALDCLKSEVEKAGGALVLNSAYRPQAYQDHLREVWDLWRLLRDSRKEECEERKKQVKAEFDHHKLQWNQRPASKSQHSLGGAIDMSIDKDKSRLEPEKFLKLATKCKLVRPMPNTDPPHFVYQSQ